MALDKYVVFCEAAVPDADEDDGVTVSVSAEVAILTRVNVLGHISRDVSLAVGASEKAAEVILMGVRRRALKEVEFRCYSKDAKRRMYISLQVDWDKYAVQLVQDSSINLFKINPNNPITEQIAPLLAQCIEYLVEEVGRREIVRTAVSYTWRSGMSAASEISKRYNLTPLDEQDLIELREAKSEQTNEIFVSDHNLPELSILGKMPDDK